MPTGTTAGTVGALSLEVQTMQTMQTVQTRNDGDHAGTTNSSTNSNNNEGDKTPRSVSTRATTPPKSYSLSPSTIFREPNTGAGGDANIRRTKDDSALRPLTPRRPSLAHNRGLSLAMPSSKDKEIEPVQEGKLDTANVYTSPASMLPRRSRGLDYTRACTNLHHSTLAESSPDASPITGRGIQIPHRRSLAGTGSSVLDSPSNLSALLWSAMPERTTLSSSVSSINMLDSDDETDTSSEDVDDDNININIHSDMAVDNEMGVDNDDPILNTPAASRLGRLTSSVTASPGMDWANLQPTSQQLPQHQPSLMSSYPMSFRRARTKRTRTKSSHHSSSSVSMSSLKPSPGSLSPSASKIANADSPAGYFGGLTRARAQSRRESLNLGTTNLRLSDGDDTSQALGQNVTTTTRNNHNHAATSVATSTTATTPPTLSEADGDASAGVVRRAVTRRGNLLPKTKGFARIKAALMEEATPADSELKHEAEVIKQVHDNDPTFASTSPDLVQRSIEDPSDAKLAPFSLHAERNSAGLGFWTAFDSPGSSQYNRYSTPPPSFRPRADSSAISDDANDQHPGLGPGHFNRLRSRSTTPLANLGSGTGPPTAADVARRVNNKRRRDDDLDPSYYTKRRAVSPGMSVASSPVLPQSPVLTADKGWGKPPKTAGGLGERSSSSSSSNNNATSNLSNGLKKVGMQGMNETHEGLMSMSID